MSALEEAAKFSELAAKAPAEGGKTLLLVLAVHYQLIALWREIQEIQETLSEEGGDK